MVELLGEFGFSTEAARAALSRLAVRGLLERHRHGRRVSYSLTERAGELLAQGDRRIFSFGRDEHGHGTWTVFWHAIPEDRRVERSRLASRLRFLGFGSVQDATWVAAADRERDVVPLVRALGAEPYCTVIVGRLSPELAPEAAVAQAWDLDDVERRYETSSPNTAPIARRRRGARSTTALRS
jgi:phenylacetic acid degradation operon negative regulatory protein